MSTTRTQMIARLIVALGIAACVPRAIAQPIHRAWVDTQARDAALERQIRAHLEAISARIEAGDAEGTMQLVAPADEVEPEFLVEFANFAKDTKTKTPHAFAIVATEGQLAIGYTFAGRLEARLPVAMRWQMAEGSPKREVQFTARCLRVGEQWTYAGELWERVGRLHADGSGAEVLYDDPSLASVALMTLDAFEAVRGRIEQGLADQGEDRPALAIAPHLQRIKLFATMEHLQVSIYPSYAAPLSGWNEPRESIKALVGTPDVDARAKRRMRALLAHEYTHVRTFFLGPTGNDMAWWIIEGIAELGADAEDALAWKRCDATVRGWAKAGRLVAFDELADFTIVPVAMYPHVYAQGHHMLGFITTRHGRAVRNRWLHALANHATLEEATQRELGLSFRELDVMWRASIAPPEIEGSP